MSFIKEFIEFTETVSQTEIKDIGDVFELATSASNAIETTVNSIAPKVETSTETSNDVVLEPSIDNRIPVVYGKSVVKGIMTDVRLADNGLDLWICYTLSEKTGPILSAMLPEETVPSFPSTTYIDRVFIDGYEAVFNNDGITVESVRDTSRPINYDTSKGGLIEVYCFNDGSENQTAPFGHASAGVDARDIFPKWTFYNRMTDLVFVLVKITYSSAAELTEIPDFTFELYNNMNKPGDVMYDYLTNSRYGANFGSEDLNV